MKSLRFVLEATVQGAGVPRVPLMTGLQHQGAPDVAQTSSAPILIRSSVARQGLESLVRYFISSVGPSPERFPSR
jgi:hypothetical protein